MEFIPGAQNITQVLNRGLASEEWVLSPANTLGLPYWGQATERLNIACNRQTAWGVECFKGEVAYRVMYVFFFFLTIYCAGHCIGLPLQEKGSTSI